MDPGTIAIAKFCSEFNWKELVKAIFVFSLIFGPTFCYFLNEFHLGIWMPLLGSTIFGIIVTILQNYFRFIRCSILIAGFNCLHGNGLLFISFMFNWKIGASWMSSIMVNLSELAEINESTTAGQTIKSSIMILGYVHITFPLLIMLNWIFSIMYLFLRKNSSKINRQPFVKAIINLIKSIAGFLIGGIFFSCFFAYFFHYLLDIVRNKDEKSNFLKISLLLGFNMLIICLLPFKKTILKQRDLCIKSYYLDTNIDERYNDCNQKVVNMKLNSIPKSTTNLKQIRRQLSKINFNTFIETIDLKMTVSKLECIFAQIKNIKSELIKEMKVIELYLKLAENIIEYDEMTDLQNMLSDAKNSIELCRAKKNEGLSVLDNFNMLVKLIKKTDKALNSNSILKLEKTFALYIKENANFSTIYQNFFQNGYNAAKAILEKRGTSQV